MILSSTSDVLRVVTSSAVTVDAYASYVDANGTTVVGGRQSAAITTATTTTVVGSPGSGVARKVKTLTIRNKHASTSVTVTLEHFNGTTAVEILKRTLAAGEQITYEDGQGFTAEDGGFYPSSGAVLDLNLNDTPGTPSADTARIFGRKIAGMMFPAFIASNGVNASCQPLLARNKVGLWVPPGNGTVVPAVFGMAALTGTGTATARNVAVTNSFTQHRRLGYVSAATAGSSCGARLAAAQFWRGNFTGGGGFFFVAQFGVSDAATVANSRMFVGMCATTAVFANAEASSNANIIGVGCDAGETTLRIMHNDGAGTATKIDLGANFPSQSLSTDGYEVAVFCPPNASWVGVQVTRLSTGHTEYREITTDLPSETTLLAFQGWRNNGATALAVGLDMASIYIEPSY